MTAACTHPPPVHTRLQLAVVCCSEFNHNVVFGSTTEHAEQRLIDRLFQLPAMHFPRGDNRFQDPSFVADVEKEVKNVTVYTSLEPCQQCAGKLQLAGISQVAFAQRESAAQASIHGAPLTRLRKSATSHIVAIHCCCRRP